MNNQGIACSDSWPERPYKGLSYYTPRDAALFGGREFHVRKCARVVSAESTKVLLLHGPTGCGKSSFLRAGLIPYLETEVLRFQFLRTYDGDNVKALFIRCTDAPLTRLAEKLWDWSEASLPIHPPDSDPQEVPLMSIRGDEGDRRPFLRNHSHSVGKLIALLSRAAEILPKTCILVFDQGEEVLTLQKGDRSERNLFFDFLVEFSKTTIDMKVIVALRKEYFADFFDEATKRKSDLSRLKAFLLDELDAKQLKDAILAPTSRNVASKYLQSRIQPGDHYNFSFAEHLPDRIISDLGKANIVGGVLPVLQITLERLYQEGLDRSAKIAPHTITNQDCNRKPMKWTIDWSDYASLGNLEDQIDLYVNEMILRGIDDQLRLDQLSRTEELALWKNFLHEYMLRVGPGDTKLSVICDSATLLKVANSLGCRADPELMIDFLASDENRILRKDQRGSGLNRSYPIILGSSPSNSKLFAAKSADSDQELIYYSLGHDAIAMALGRWQANQKILFEQERLKKERERSKIILNVTSRLIQSVHDSLASGKVSMATASEHLRAAGDILSLLSPSDDPGAVAQQSDLMNKLAVGLLVLGDLDDADQISTRTLALLNSLGDRIWESYDIVYQWIIANHVSGDLYKERNSEATLKAYLIALRDNMKLAQQDPDDRKWKRLLSVSFNKVGDAFLEQNSADEAYRNYSESLRISTLLLDAEKSAADQHAKAISLFNVANACKAGGQFQEALQNYESSMTIRNLLLKEEPDNAGWQRDLSSIHIGVGEVFGLQGQVIKAVNEFDLSVSILGELFEKDRSNRYVVRDLKEARERLSAATSSYRK